MPSGKRLVIALGGNALLEKGKESFKQQFKAAQKTAGIIAPFAKKFQVILTHGNGPQVGNILLQQELSRKTVEPLPLDVCVAMSQAQIGYMLQQALENEFKKRGMKIFSDVVLTQIIVSEKDPAFKNPAKFIGPYYSKARLKSMPKNFIVNPDPRGGFRRVVASPKPLKIWEEQDILTLVEKNFLAICCGGGGIPVIKKHGRLYGVEAVIDKDLAAAVLAKLVKAETLLILTDVDNAFIDFKKPGQKALHKIKLPELKRLLKQGHFGEGSMKPKIQAAVNFLEAGGKKAIITSIKKSALALEGKAGTIAEK